MEYIISKEEYLSVVEAWNHIPNRTSTDHIIYNALRGHDLKRGFSPITSETKLQNGMSPWKSFNDAKYNAYFTVRPYEVNSYDSAERKVRRELEHKERMDALSKKFGVTFTPELITMLREMLK